MKSAYDYQEWFKREVQHVAQHGCFDVALTPLDVRWHYEVSKSLPCHELVIQPLLQYAASCVFYGIKSESPLESLVSRIAKKERGKHRLIASPSNAVSEPTIWNSHGWQRGSILIDSDPPTNILANIFGNTYRVGFTNNFKTGHSASAFSAARKQAQHGRSAAFLLPASNGVEWLTVVASNSVAPELFELACRSCRVTKESSEFYQNVA